MLFNDRAADRQSHAHTLWLGRIECIEEPLHFLRLQSDAKVLYANCGCWPTIVGVTAPANQQKTLLFFDAVHRVHPVHHEVEQNLLELNTVSKGQGEVLGD